MIVLAALIILGPEELPGMLRRIGRLYGELKRLTDSVQHEVRGVLEDPTRDLSETAELARNSLAELSGSVRATLTDAPVAAPTVAGAGASLAVAVPARAVWAAPPAVWAPPPAVSVGGLVWPAPRPASVAAFTASAGAVGGSDDDHATARPDSAS